MTQLLRVPFGVRQRRVSTIGISVAHRGERLGFDDARAVPGLLYGGEEVGDVGAPGVADVRLFRGVVDARVDAVELVQLALDAVGTRRARHAGEREFDLVMGGGRLHPRPSSLDAERG